MFACPSYYSHDWNWKEGNEGLFLFVTGLNGHPVWAAAYAAQVAEEHPEYEIRIPAVPNSGNCSLEEAAEPFVAMVRDYIQKNPGKPINIIGTSNGGRIGAYIESKLRTEQASIRLSAIAGAYFGSSLMDLCDNCCIAPWLFHEDIIRDLKVGSETSQKMIQTMNEPLPTGVIRKFQFYASQNDDRLSLSSSLPLIPNQDASYEIYRGESHMSITDRVRQVELKRSYEWMQQQRDAAACLQAELAEFVAI